MGPFLSLNLSPSSYQMEKLVNKLVGISTVLSRNTFQLEIIVTVMLALCQALGQPPAHIISFNLHTAL